MIGELGPETVASLTKGVTNLGPRLSVVSAKGEMLTHLGTEPIGEGLGQFIAPHGITSLICNRQQGDLAIASGRTTILCSRCCSSWPRIGKSRFNECVRMLEVPICSEFSIAAGKRVSRREGNTSHRFFPSAESFEMPLTPDS